MDRRALAEEWAFWKAVGAVLLLLFLDWCARIWRCLRREMGISGRRP
jgi:hypothetical protein